MARPRLQARLAPVLDEYDFIIIDTPPTLGVFTQAPLIASTEVLIPVDVGYFSLQGIRQILEDIEKIRTHYNRALTIGGILLTKFDSRTILSKQVKKACGGVFTRKLSRPRSRSTWTSFEVRSIVKVFSRLTSSRPAHATTKTLSMKSSSWECCAAPNQEGCRCQSVIRLLTSCRLDPSIPTRMLSPDDPKTKPPLLPPEGRRPNKLKKIDPFEVAKRDYAVNILRPSAGVCRQNCKAR